MGKPIFLELKVFRIAERLADAVYSAVAKWDPFPRDAVGARLVRAVDGIAASIAEGHGRGMTRDDRRVIRAALYQALYWLRRASRRKLLTPDQVEKVQPVLDDLSARIRAYLKRFGQRQPPRGPTAPGP
jgi:four helix bundle protein